MHKEEIVFKTIEDIKGKTEQRKSIGEDGRGYGEILNEVGRIFLMS